MSNAGKCDRDSISQYTLQWLELEIVRFDIQAEREDLVMRKKFEPFLSVWKRFDFK